MVDFIFSSTRISNLIWIRSCWQRKISADERERERLGNLGPLGWPAADKQQPNIWAWWTSLGRWALSLRQGNGNVCCGRRTGLPFIIELSPVGKQ